MSIQKQGAVALGLFDGVHQGHRAVLQAAVRQKKNGLIPGAFTFHAEMSAMKNAPGYLYPTDLKIHILETECGMERIYAPPFEMVCEMSGEDFVREILCRRMNAAYAVCGNDFRFGKDARWDAEDLRRLGEKAGITIEIVDDVRCGGEKVSSSAVRSLLLEGDIKHANLLLGAPTPSSVRSSTGRRSAGASASRPSTRSSARDRSCRATASMPQRHRPRTAGGTAH